MAEHKFEVGDAVECRGAEELRSRGMLYGAQRDASDSPQAGVTEKVLPFSGTSQRVDPESLSGLSAREAALLDANAKLKRELENLRVGFKSEAADLRMSLEDHREMRRQNEAEITFLKRELERARARNRKPGL